MVCGTLIQRSYTAQRTSAGESFNVSPGEYLYPNTKNMYSPPPAVCASHTKLYANHEYIYIYDTAQYQIHIYCLCYEQVKLFTTCVLQKNDLKTMQEAYPLFTLSIQIQMQNKNKHNAIRRATQDNNGRKRPGVTLMHWSLSACYVYPVLLSYLPRFIENGHLEYVTVAPLVPALLRFFSTAVRSQPHNAVTLLQT